MGLLVPVHVVGSGGKVIALRILIVTSERLYYDIMTDCMMDPATAVQCPWDRLSDLMAMKITSTVFSSAGACRYR